MTDWQPIERYIRGVHDNDVLLWNGLYVFPGWLSDDGWHDARNQDRDDMPEALQPTHFMPYPKPPDAGSKP